MRSSWMAFLLVILVSCIVTCGSPDAGGRRALTPAASITPAPAATPTGVPRPTLPPTRRPATPQPSPTAAPATSAATELRSPMVIDSEAGRLYLTGVVDGSEQIVALAATDGRLLATYGLTGTFDVDPAHGWLYVDQAETGLTVLDAQTGALHAAIPLPADRPAHEWGRGWYPPQADPVAGYVLAFRFNTVYVVDPDRGVVVDTVAFDIPYISCGSPAGPSSISWAEYDDTRRLLYLCFFAGSCVPHMGETCVSYDLNAGAEIARYYPPHSSSNAGTVAADGYLYGSSWHRIPYWGGYSAHWIWRDGQPWFESTRWKGVADLYLDSARGLLYESISGFRAFDAGTMALQISIPSPVEGDLVGYDPGTDQLYFLSEGQLYTWPASAIQPPPPEPLEVSTPPAEPVVRLVVSPAWPQDRTVFGLWGDADPPRGSPYISGDGGSTWARPRGGLQSASGWFLSLAVSPGYAGDQTILAGVSGMGVFKSTDGGRLWQPSSAGLSTMDTYQILLSPGFERDQMAFARYHDNYGMLYRSTDGGATWRPLGVDLDRVVMSPEFDRDRTMVGVVRLEDVVCYDLVFRGNEMLVSRDSGDTWEYAGDGPGGVWIGSVSIAPGFGRRQVIFAHGDGALYRSADGGRSWDVVLSPVPGAEIVYGPETEDGYLLFLRATSWEWDGNVGRHFVKQSALYRSEDGVSWQEIELPPDIVPTALAISPAFAQDRLLFVGTEDGRVVAFEDQAD